MKTLAHLAHGSMGIERETLRTKANGELANTSHPETLGNVFTHPNITIDYAETLVEIVSSVHNSAESLYDQLLSLHRFCAQNISSELLWPASMPCKLPQNPEHIEFGYFGQSNSGKIKRLYRSGLAYRYGRPMQMIAGIHFNYSPPAEFWSEFAELKQTKFSLSWKNSVYMGMLRNIRRYSWLICYLLGASPTTDESFQPAQNLLNKLGKNTLGWINSTSLRMSKLGYQNKVDFSVSFNSLEEYAEDLISAVLTPDPKYEYLGLTDPEGNFRQISTNILQIENEYYTSARPKQITKSNEAPALALLRRGIEYIELRLPDINPYDPCGISIEQIRFLEIFMIYCLISESKAIEHCEENEINHNRLRTACCGMSQQYKLFINNQEIDIEQAAGKILEEMYPIANSLDEQVNGQNKAYQKALEIQIQKLKNRELLSKQVLEESSSLGFINWALQLQKKHLQVLSVKNKPQIQNYLEQLRDKSLSDFKTIEENAKNQEDFADFLTHYFDELKIFHNQHKL